MRDLTNGSTRRGFIGGSAALAFGGGALTSLAARQAHAADEASLVAAAKKEGECVVYSNADPGATERALKAFTDRYGVKTDFQRLTGAALAQRFTAEYDTNNNLTDLFISSDPIYPLDAIKKGWLTRAADLPSMADWPKSGYLDGLVPINVNPYVLAWNSQLIPNGLKSFEELNDPKWRGKVMVGDPRVLASARNWYVAIAQKFGDNFVRELGKHVTYSPSVVPGMQQVASGAQAIYAPTILLSALDIISKGAPVKYATVDPIVISQSVASVPAKAPHPNAGRLLLNWWMSREGQEVYSKGGYSLLPNVPGTQTLGAHAEIDPTAGDRELSRINALLGIG